jgi:ABC-2 type transport system ATP-binding protein
MDRLARDTRLKKLLGDFGLLKVRKKRIGQYSKGMRQKLSLARALLHDPPVLLLDEPTSAMDPESARLVRDSIRTLRSARRAFIICTHNLAEAEELADKIAIIQDGKIIAQGSPGELKADFLGPSEYQLTLAKDINGHQVIMPEGVSLTAKGTNWIRYQTNQPSEVNPSVLRHLLDQGLPVVSLEEVARSIEQVYLQAVTTPNEEEPLSA